MLEELSISGLGVIDRASARFAPGFTVLTGETGAGKTMIVTSLRLLSGARADAARVRTGSDRAIVEGRLKVTGTAADTPESAELIESSGAELDDDGTVIAVRTVGTDGRSRAHLGGRSVPVGVMGRLTSSALTIHGQNDQLRLLRPDRQRAALDTFAGERADSALAAYQAARQTWTETLDRLDALRADRRQIVQEADRLRLGVAEIGAVDPQAGEDDELTGTIRRLTDLEAIRASASDSADVISGDAASIIDGLGQVRTMLQSSGDVALEELSTRVDEVLTAVTDIGTELTAFLSGLPTDADALDSLLNRQAELKALVRKYAPDIDGVLAWHTDAQRRLAEIDDPEGSIEQLETAADAARSEVVTAAATLHAVRAKAATSMARKVSKELAGLAMGDSQLAVQVTPEPANDDDRLAIDLDGERVHAGADGTDRVDFGLVPHRGADPLPIATSASGGELSRVMLALEVVLAEPTSGTVMVFDEVDAGVGGHAAVEIARRLARLACAHQVIVVTHLPQVAAFADHHLVIGKSGGTRTAKTSTVRVLDRDERVAELARMLAGLGESDTGRAHAEELLTTADTQKAEFGRRRAAGG